MANEPSTTAREFAFGSDSSRPSLTDWLVRDLRTTSSTDRPAPPPIAHEEDEGHASVAPPARAGAEAVEQAPDADDPGFPEGQFERYEPIQVEAIDGEVDLPVAASAILPASIGGVGAAVASVSHEALPPPPDEPLTVPSIEAAAPSAGTESADVASDVAMSPPEDWLEEDEMGAAGAFFSSNADFDESDESAPITDEGTGASLSPHVFDPEDDGEEEQDDTVAPLLVAAGIGSNSSRWKTIAAVAAAVLVVVLFGQRLARRHAQAAASSQPAATIPPQAPALDAPHEESTAEAEDALAMDEAKDGKRVGGGRGHAGPGSPPSDPALPGGPSVARFPDLPREILNQLEQVFESESGQRNKGATDSIERYSR